MRVPLPRKRTILLVHRWLGILSALFLMVLALTGLALNHTERLGLNRITLGSPWLLSLYGMSPAEGIRSWRINESDTLSWHEENYFYNDRELASAGPLVAILEAGELTVIVAADGLLYLTPEGELVERVPVLGLPFGDIQAAGRSPSGYPLLSTDSGLWQPYPDWLDFAPYTGEFNPAPQEPVSTPADVRQAILAAFRGEGLTLYRVLLDLHSGRLFGWGGRTVMDLSAIAILLLVSSGIGGWLRKSRWGRS